MLKPQHKGLACTPTLKRLTPRSMYCRSRCTSNVPAQQNCF